MPLTSPIGTISRSYPYLSLSRYYALPYEYVLQLADMIRHNRREHDTDALIAMVPNFNEHHSLLHDLNAVNRMVDAGTFNGQPDIYTSTPFD